MKICTHCKLEKRDDCFWPNGAYLRSRCADCENEIKRTRYASDPIYADKMKKAQSKSRKKNPKERSNRHKIWRENNVEYCKRAHIYSKCKHTDRKKGFETASKEEIYKVLDIGKCHYCGFEDAIGVDRIDNSKGHIVGNLLPCCHECNVARSDHFTVEEMEIIGAAISKVREARKVNN